MINESPSTVTHPGICFLDRDGVVIRETEYLADPDKVQLLPGVPEALRALRTMGFSLAIVTNQSGVARGMFSETDVRRVNDKMLELLALEGITIDALRYCPHHPEGKIPEYAQDCDCRKPRTGMFKAIATELKRPLRDSAMIGDKFSDVLAGESAGCFRSILVRTGHGNDEISALTQTDATRFPICDNLADAVIFLENVLHFQPQR